LSRAFALAAMPARDIVLVLLVCVAWALNFLISALALREIPPFLFTALRFALLRCRWCFFLKRPRPGNGRACRRSPVRGRAAFRLSFSALKLAGDLSSPAIVMQSYVPMTHCWRGGGWASASPGAPALAIAVSFAGVLVLGFDPLVLDQPMSCC
jgi:O-acetylserine/cysteine efflux transporter